jgi:serine/threonine-protein kinase
MNTASDCGRTVVAGCTIEREVASSQHATVFLAHRDGVAVALKLARRAGDALAPARLAREALALGRVAHPCISPLLDAGTWIDGTPYVITPWVDGTVLEHRLQLGAMPWGAVVPVLSSIAQGLCALHAAGIVHRDVKPTNIMVPASGDPAAILLDLGHASLCGDRRITQTGAAVGSLPYMAPEQVRGGALDGRADLYALGVILYRALTGCFPFTGEQVLRGQLELIPPRRRAPELAVPPEAEDLCRWLLTPKPAERLPSAHVLAVTLTSVSLAGTCGPPAAPPVPSTNSPQRSALLPVPVEKLEE